MTLFRRASLPALILASALGMALVPSAHGAGTQDDLRLEVARQWAEKGDYEKAVQELRLFLNEHPDAAEVYARIGSLRLRQGKLKQAAENFKVALKKDPNLAEAKEGLAKVKDLESKGEALPPELPKETPPKAAPKAPAPAPKGEGGYNPAMDSEGSSTGIYAMKEFQEALRLYQDKKPDEALAKLKTVLGKSPGHPGAYYLGGVIRYEKGDMAKAAYNFKRSFAYPERGFNAHFYLGRINHRQNKVPEAIDHYEKYIKATKSEAGRKQAEAYLAQLRGKKPEEKPAEPVKPVEPTKPEEHAAAPKDTAHAKPADAHAADTGHGHAAPPPVDRSPFPMVLTKAGYLPFVVADSNGASGKKLREAYEAFKKEKYEKSADLLKEVVKLYGGSPNAEAAHLDLASVYVRLGLWDGARDRILDYLSNAKEPQRYRDMAFYLEGLMHLGKRDGEKAERAFLKVKPGSFGGPSQEELDFRLVQAAELMKDMKKWAAYLEKAQAGAKDPLRKARLAHQSGHLHGRHGRSEKALEFYKKAMEGCANGAAKEEGLEELGDVCADSHLRIADMEFKRKRWKESLAEYKRFAAGYPEHKESAWVHYQMANIYQATRNLEQALNEYKKVIDNYPDSYWASQAQWKREDAIWRKEYEEVLD